MRIYAFSHITHFYIAVRRFTELEYSRFRMVDIFSWPVLGFGRGFDRSGASVKQPWPTTGRE